MSSPTYFFVAATVDRLLHVDCTKDVELAMFVLKDRPILTHKGLHLADKLVLVEEFRSVKAAQARLRKFQRLSLRKQHALIEETNPQWNDISSKWFPVLSSSKTFMDVNEYWPGSEEGGVAAFLDPRLPTRSASEAADPCASMTFEELVEFGAYKVLQVGPART